MLLALLLAVLALCSPPLTASSGTTTDIPTRDWTALSNALAGVCHWGASESLSVVCDAWRTVMTDLEGGGGDSSTTQATGFDPGDPESAPAYLEAQCSAVCVFRTDGDVLCGGDSVADSSDSFLLSGEADADGSCAAALAAYFLPDKKHPAPTRSITATSPVAIDALDLDAWSVPNANVESLTLSQYLGSSRFYERIGSAFPTLGRLWIIDSEFAEVPPQMFTTLTHLTDLAISTTKLWSLPAGVFDPLTALTSLDLSSNSIVQLPHNIFDRLASLTNLDLASNRIAQMEGTVFSRLSRLTSLGLGKNSIREIPLGALDACALSLQDLSLSTNRITLLPQGLLSKHVMLESLHLEDNALTALPADLFVGLGSLAVLFLNNNPIMQLPSSAAFRALTSLTRLVLSETLLTTLPAGLFDTTTSLQSLSVVSSRLQSLPSGIFEHLTQLTLLELSMSSLTSLPAGVFRRLTRLKKLQIFQNMFTALPLAVFDTLTALEELDVSGCALTVLPADLFAKLTSLESLDISNNSIRSIPLGAFDKLTHLSSLYMQGNPVGNVAPPIFDKLTGLAVLHIDSIGLSSLSPALLSHNPLLVELGLDDNAIMSIPAGFFDTPSSLMRLYMSSNSLTALPEQVLSSLTSLTLIFLARNAIKGMPMGLLRGLTQLMNLDLSGNALTELPVDIFEDLTSMITLSIGHNRLATLPTLQSMTSLQFLDLSSNLLESLIPLPSTLQYLDVSANPLELPPSILASSTLLTLDISGTKLGSWALTCSWESDEHRMTFLNARGLRGHVQEGLPTLVSSCIRRVDSIDISGNSLTNMTLVQSFLGAVFNLQTNTEDNDGGVNSRASQVSLGLKSPVECSLNMTATTRYVSNSMLSLPALKYSCSCALGYHLEGSSGVCVADPPTWTTGKVAGLVIGAMLLTVVVGGAVLLATRRHRRVLADLELNRLLLEETQEEVIGLKRAWEILPSEIQLEARVDGDSPGAFGEVWRGKWDGIVVAVKLLQQSAMDFDDAAKDEFQKEIEFMQKTRHPNIVRFFGAGQWHTGGVPFFVVELVTNGSLRSFLRGAEGGAGRPAIAWAVKLRLALDVARGVAYIHDQGQMHRDLKSGNVLITQDMRAKIADFGTIKEMIIKRKALRGGAHGSGDGGAHTHLSSAVGGATGTVASGASSGHSLELTAGKGTPLYMAPEVMRGSDYDKSADVWSYGVLLWELAAQRSPDLLAQEGRTKGPILANMLTLLEAGKRLRVAGGVVGDAEGAEWSRDYVELMTACWAADAGARPGFGVIVGRLEGWV